jgi:hypothetical protein
MSEADEYRGYAEACFRVAQGATDESERARWTSMAQHWLQWAQDEEAGRPPSRPKVVPSPKEPG